MTGYGRGRSSHRGQSITAEVSSVNRRQSEISLNLPRGLAELEPRLRDEINANFSRGRLTAVVAIHGSGAKSKSGTRNGINATAAAQYHRDLQKLAHRLKLGGEVSLETVLRGPGVLVEEPEEIEPEEYYPPVHAALEQALKQLLQMRKREGTSLAKDLRARLRGMKRDVAAIAKRAPHVMERHRGVLFDRIKHAGLEISPHDERLLKELVFFADRSDISEELTRLQSHLEQFSGLLSKDEPVGRTMDFIIQEMNREVNTIGSKANDLEISQTVVAVKTELEKVREQVQNIE
ncbi:MAG: YicC/YloC family endoribonuclease [Verrucomicrobiota bacterium]